MASYFVWLRGLRAPQPVKLPSPDMTALDKARALTRPMLLSEEDEGRDLAMLARLFPAPPQKIEEP